MGPNVSDKESSRLRNMRAPEGPLRSLSLRIYPNAKVLIRGLLDCDFRIENRS